jgi:hypothetical protein
MFAIAGIAFGVPNRVFLAVVGSAFCVLVEVGLNAVNASKMVGIRLESLPDISVGLTRLVNFP